MSRLIVVSSSTRADQFSRCLLRRAGITRRYRAEWVRTDSLGQSPPDLTDVAGVLALGGYQEALRVAELTDLGQEVPWAAYLLPPSLVVPTAEFRPLASADWVGAPWVCSRKRVRDAVSTLRPRALPVGVDTSVFRPLMSRESLRAAEGLSGRFVVGCVAENEGHNRLPALFKAFAALRSEVPDACLRLLTDATTYWPKHSAPQRRGWDLAELSGRYGIDGHVQLGVKTPWYGATDRDLNAFYNTLDALVVCGVGDGLGMEILEAMSAGVPVVAPDYGVPAELVHGRGLIVRLAARWLSSPHSEELALIEVEHLAEQLLRLQQDAGLRQACVRSGRRVAHRFSLEDAAAAWRPVLTQWLREAAGRRRRQARAEAARPKTVLVRRDRGIGDVLFALSAAHQLKCEQPRTRLEFVTLARHAPWVAWFGFVDKVHVSAPSGAYDRTLDYEQTLDYNFSGDRCQWMGKQAGVEVSALVPPPEVPAKLVAKATKLMAWRQRKSHSPRRVLALAPCGSRSTLVRSLSLEQVRLAVASVPPEDAVVLLCEEAIGGVTAPNLVNLSGQLSPEEAIAVVSLCDGLVGVDSGLVHWAGVFRKPVVALFTHIGALQRMHVHSNFIAIQPSLPCAPCGDVWPQGPRGPQPPCRPDYRWTPYEPRVACVAVHDGRLAVSKLYELLDGSPRREVLNVDRYGNSTRWELPAVPGAARSDRSALSDQSDRAELTAIAILTLNTWTACTRRCLEKVLEHTAPPLEIVLLDNGGNREEAALLAAELGPLRAQYPHVRLVLDRSGRNLGFPKGVNRALRSVSPEARYVCLLNSDCYIEEPRWNVRVAGLFQQDWRLAALSLTQGEHRYFLDGETGEDYFFPDLDAQLGDCEVINGACLLVDRKKTGPFKLDERFSPASREDDDLSFWIRAQGWAIGQSPDFRIHHEHSATLRQKNFRLRWEGEEFEYAALLERNRLLLLDKWQHLLHPRLPQGDSLKALARFYRPRVSVVLPTYKRLEINGAAIGSVLAQSMTDLELLVVTASAAEQRELARRYRDESRVRVLRQQRRGIANARNTGLAEARGRYLAHMDDDEYWRPDHLARMVQFLDYHEHVMLAYADVRKVRGRFVEGRFKPLKEEGHPWCREFEPGSLLRENCIPASAAVLRRETRETVGYFDESYRYADDWEYWLRVAEAHPVAHNCTLKHDGIATVEYRLHQHDQATARDTDVWAAEFARIRQRYGRR